MHLRAKFNESTKQLLFMKNTTPEDNLKALFNFKRSIKNNLSPNNRKIVMAEVHLSYYWDNQEAEVITKIMISLDNYPFSSLDVIEKDWLNSTTFYTQFQTGYNHFSFSATTNTLSIESNVQSKMGDHYKVVITEI